MVKELIHKVINLIERLGLQEPLEENQLVKVAINKVGKCGAMNIKKNYCHISVIWF